MSGELIWLQANIPLNGNLWDVVLANLRPQRTEYLERFRRSCEDQLDNERTEEIARFMLDAIDHILTERRNDNG